MQCVSNSIAIKPDIFVLEEDSEAEIPTYNDVTNLTLDDIIDIANTKELDSIILDAAYDDVSNINTGNIISNINFTFMEDNDIQIHIEYIDAENKSTYPIIVDNKSYQGVFINQQPI